jgi:hypothetical protein
LPPTPRRSRPRWPRWLPALVAASLLCLWASAPVVAADAPRLKYRGKGSVCMCSDATDEDEIARAFEARAAAAKRAPGATRAAGDKPADARRPAGAKGPTGAADPPPRPAAPRASAPAGSPATRSPQEQRP